jgi:hypothetical protein
MCARFVFSLHAERSTSMGVPRGPFTYRIESDISKCCNY